MFARLMFGQVPPDKLDETIDIFRRSIVPAMKQQPGNQGGRLLTDPATGKIVTVSFWDSEAALEAGVSSGYVDEQRAKEAHLFSSQPVVEHYEFRIRTSQPRSSFVRLATLQIQPDRIDEALELLREAADIVGQQPGCHGLTAMVQQATRKARVFTVWETEKDMLAGEESGFYQQQRAKVADLLTEPPGPGEHFEVSVSVVTEGRSPQGVPSAAG
jgi:heme-degrading monooxygenase HmoA